MATPRVPSRWAVFVVGFAACAPVATQPAGPSADRCSPGASAVAPAAVSLAPSSLGPITSATPPAATSAAAPIALVGASAAAPPGRTAPPPGIYVAASGGPRGTRACEFHESVDTYPRRCTVSVFDDGSLLVDAKGTKLNPRNGFTFRMGGGPGSFDIAGELDAFSICKGPFVAKMQAIEDRGRTIYEARLSEHCMIVIR